MADNITTNTVSGGATMATDDVSGKHYQRIKLIHGADGANDGDVSKTNPLPVQPRSATGTVTSVNDIATSTTLLASNTSRLGAAVYNDSTADLYVKLGATASTASFTVKLGTGDYFEVPFGYTGIIDGIWASDASGAARITEMT